MVTELKTPELSRHAAVAFVERWKNTTEELQHAQSFWADFFRTLCGIEDEKLAGIEYQKKVKGDVSGNQEYIDVYWKNVALIEHKSAGKNLDKAEMQARGYLRSLPPGYRPKTIIVSDFANIRIIDVALNRTHEFPLSCLPDHIHRFEAIISGNRTRISQEEITVDKEAARLMANLYLELEDHGFEGHETSIFLVRILFLLFGDDTGMWAKNTFLKLVMGTREDGSDIGTKLNTLFEVLNTPTENRSQDLGAEFKSFPYVNGGIFAEKISIINFKKKMRVALVEVANYDWTTINPTIFGSLFQLIKNKEARRELGEHYTSEENINKIVYPLFLDGLQERLASAWDSKRELKKLRQDLSKIKIFDPACGCGNFLVVSYRHLRQLELELIVRLNNLEGVQDSMQLDGSMGLSITLNQFYGIEIEEWPAQVAQVALYLTDHQENKRLERITGESPNRFPITASATIANRNALNFNWNDFLPIDSMTFILGNPPFHGASWQNEIQKEDQSALWRNSKRGKSLDYVANWFLKAAEVTGEFDAKAAFVATNSITQGEQPAIIWDEMYKHQVKIDFAHRTFAWENDAAGVAGVHCVIIGFSRDENVSKKKLWHYADPKGEPTVTNPFNINPYLFDGVNTLVSPRSTPLNRRTPEMSKGSQPTDAGWLSSISPEEAELIRKQDPVAGKYLRRLMGGQEFIHNQERYCLWLVDATPGELANSPELRKRLQKVREMRLASPKKATREDAERPQLFQENRQPEAAFIAVPEVSSENRAYVPIGFFEPEVVPTNKIQVIQNASLPLFAQLVSSTFNAWVRSVSGRLESRFSISSEITYNNFPFLDLSKDSLDDLTELASDVLGARLNYEGSTLAELYGVLTMPAPLLKAHKSIDKYVLKLYGLKPNSTDEEIMSRLFELYVSEQADQLL